MNNNKILTVSYGTFSCTLEGFEDSFGTMKAIAEYFRDLAADDRYFGAEPPQPDAEMLARIAEKEVARRVQARQQDGKIVLSALEDAAPAPQPAEAAAIAAPLVTAEQAAPVATAADAPAVADAPEADAPEDTLETAAIETQSIDVAEAPDVTDENVVAITTALIEDTTALADAAIADVATEDVPDIVPGQPDAEVEAFFAESATFADATDEALDDTDTIEAEEVEEAAAEAPAPDSIAAKLQRIRAVVAQHEEADEEDDYLEDEHAEASGSEGSPALIAEARADIEQALEEDETSDLHALSLEDEEDEDDDVSAILSRLTETPEDIADEALIDTGDEDEDALSFEETAEDEDEDEDDLSLEETAEVEDEDEDMSLEDTVSNLFDEDEGTLVSEDEDALADTAQDDDQESVAAAPHRARVIKVKRADLEAAIEKGELEEYEDDTETAEDESVLDAVAPAKRRETALSREDEEDLVRELAELEDDIAAEAKEAEDNAVAAASDDEDAEAAVAEDAEDLAEEEEPSARAARKSLPSIDDDAGGDMNRLLAETDHKMDEPESATRRDAFAHLRAAVAAKKADSTIEDEAEGFGTTGAYREDLAEVVRPRRPVASEARTERPEESRPAPLKLVAEQRIDVERPGNAGPVRPRRVAAMADAAQDGGDGESFADFAADMGANSLPELLEAAAAYLSFVEGREQFSRPQLMTKVRQVTEYDGFSREEGLRSFGQLLRSGKIEKIRGGRFTVSDDIGYRPDERAAG
ncbi:hypothetical protein AB2B41_04935 [Marimonas sp. MJW-29]|uniref:Lipoprotein n=1 Tax=Sulfitobacter sediminis TaxID=3234186 RepID=A0ABV3RJ14_9RHOB